MTFAPKQSMLANVTASLGIQEEVVGKPSTPKIQSPFSEFAFGVCFQSTTGGGEGGAPIVNMNQFTGGNDANYSAASYAPGEQDYTGIGTAAPGAGTYNVGTASRTTARPT